MRPPWNRTTLDLSGHIHYSHEPWIIKNQFTMQNHLNYYHEDFLISFLCWHKVIIHQPSERIHGVDDLADNLILPHEYASLGVQRGVPRMNQNPFKMRHLQQPW